MPRYRSDLENALLNLVNDFRDDNGRDRLEVDRELQEAARKHSDTQDDNDTVAHEPDIGPRIRGEGYADAQDGTMSLAENIGLDPPVPYTKEDGQKVDTPEKFAKEVFDSWLAEGPGGPHYEAMLNADFQDVGISVREGGYKGGPALYVTMDFGKPSLAESAEHDKSGSIESYPYGGLRPAGPEWKAELWPQPDEPPGSEAVPTPPPLGGSSPTSSDPGSSASYPGQNIYPGGAPGLYGSDPGGSSSDVSFGSYPGSNYPGSSSDTGSGLYGSSPSGSSSDTSSSSTEDHPHSGSLQRPPESSDVPELVLPPEEDLDVVSRPEDLLPPLPSTEEPALEPGSVQTLPGAPPPGSVPESGLTPEPTVSDTVQNLAGNKPSGDDAAEDEKLAFDDLPPPLDVPPPPPPSFSLGSAPEPDARSEAPSSDTVKDLGSGEPTAPDMELSSQLAPDDILIA